MYKMKISHFFLAGVMSFISSICLSQPPRGPYYKIVLTGTERALAATADAEVITVPAFTGTPEQLWRIDQLTDGTYRIMPKIATNSGKKLALVSSGDSNPTLAIFDMNSDNSKWNFKPL